MRIEFANICSRGLLTAMTAAIALPVTAQTTQGRSGPLLEEIVVTAEHREASLQDTQISLSAISAGEIRSWESATAPTSVISYPTSRLPS